jgi:hypothetical protein
MLRSNMEKPTIKILEEMIEKHMSNQLINMRRSYNEGHRRSNSRHSDHWAIHYREGEGHRIIR